MWRTQRDKFFLTEARKGTRNWVCMGLLVEAAVLGLFAAAGYPIWRVAAVAGVYAAFLVGHRVFMGSAREGQRVEPAFIGMNVSAQLFVVASTALTGGVHSPFIPGTMLPAIMSLLFFGPQAVARWVALSNGLLVIAMLCLPASVAGPELASPYYTIAIVTNLAWSLFMLHLAVGKLSRISSETGESMVCMREDRLAEAEAQLRRLQSVGAKVAHELKNPLASIKGLCQLVARAPASDRTLDRLAVVTSEISRMETILNEYLTFSRPLEDLTPEPTELVTLGKDVLAVLAGRADQAGVTMAVEGAPTQVMGDPRRLKEALLNLAANALEATPSGGKVTVRVKRTATGATVEIIDNGRGIAPDDLERLGTSFFTTRENGTGLGVVLAQGVITQHGGTLTYASTVGAGTTATIALPQAATAPAAVPATPEPAPRAAMVEARA